MKGPVAQSIREKLVRAFAPTGLEIDDESDLAVGKLLVVNISKNIKKGVVTSLIGTVLFRLKKRI